jgi:hypothetical protein
MICPIGTIFKTGNNDRKKQSINRPYIRSLLKPEKEMVVFITLKMIIPVVTSKIMLIIKETSKADNTGAIV